MKPPVPQNAVFDAALAEPYAFALITWPVAAAAVQFATAEDFWWQIAAIVGLVLLHMSAYGRGRGAAFGNLLILMSVTVAGAWAILPSAWAFVAFPILLIGLHGAQRALWRAYAAIAPPVAEVASVSEA